MVGGYRLVRKLGDGARGEVYLGHAGAAEDAMETSTAAVKIFREGASGQSIADEIGVLARTSSPHLLRLMDVATAPDGRPCAILPRLGSVSLARLMAERPSLAAGETITILAPLCVAVTELHATRACHGAIRPGAVLFDQKGAPVLACFGKASRFGDVESALPATVAERAAEPRVAADLAALAALAELVLGRISAGESSRRVADILDWLRGPDSGGRISGGAVSGGRVGDRSARFAEELADRLFDLTAAVPIDFAHPIVAGRGAVPARVITSTPAARPRTVDSATALRNPGAGQAKRLLSKLLPTAAVARIPLPAVAESLTRARTAIASVRRPFWIAGAAGVVAIVLALSFAHLPGEADAASGHAVTRPTVGEVPAQARPSARPQSASPAAPSAVRPGGEASGEASGSGGGSAKSAILADDPVAAAEALLRARERCILKRSVLCLDGVDQANSSALEDDGYLIRSLQGGGAADASSSSFSGATIVLSERLGDSALLAVQGGEPEVAKGTALLIVKGQSGWRIRDFLTS